MRREVVVVILSFSLKKFEGLELINQARRDWAGAGEAEFD